MDTIPLDSRIQKIMSKPRQAVNRAFISLFGTKKELDNSKPLKALRYTVDFLGMTVSAAAYVFSYMNYFSLPKGTYYLPACAFFYFGLDMIISGDKGLSFVGIAREAIEEVKDAERLKKVKREFSNIDYVLDNEEVTLGSRQLIISKDFGMLSRDLPPADIDEKINRLYAKLQDLEHVLKGTPTFGCEFSIQKKQVFEANPNYNLNRAIMLANIFMILAGGKNIRPSSNDLDGTIEFRINPSYAPVTIALAAEMFEQGILPSEIPVIYSVNMVGKEVLEYSIPLILVNYVTGLTPFAQEDSREDVALCLRDIHIYKGATVDVKSGYLIHGEKQLNILAGIAGKINSSSEYMPIKERLETDISTRLNRMLMPFLAEPEDRNIWAESICDIFELSYKDIVRLNRKLYGAQHESGKWNLMDDLGTLDPSTKIADVSAIYDKLEQKVISEKPELYFKLLDLKL